MPSCGEQSFACGTICCVVVIVRPFIITVDDCLRLPLPRPSPCPVETSSIMQYSVCKRKRGCQQVVFCLFLSSAQCVFLFCLSQPGAKHTHHPLYGRGREMPRDAGRCCCVVGPFAPSTCSSNETGCGCGSCDPSPCALLGLLCPSFEESCLLNKQSPR